MKYTVYMHITPSNKRYIGITCKKTKYRWNNGKGYKNNKHFYSAIIKYGWENIEHIILFENLTKEEAEQKEIELIKKYSSNNREYGYNIENGGKCVGRVSDETKNKLSIASKKLWADKDYRKKQSLKIAGMSGKKHTEETKQKMREKAKKRKLSDDELKRLRTMNIGRKLSEETKEKIRKSMLGRKMSEETKKKLSDKRKGKPTWIKGKKLSEEHKNNISKGLLRYYQQKNVV